MGVRAHGTRDTFAGLPVLRKRTIEYKQSVWNPRRNRQHEAATVSIRIEARTMNKKDITTMHRLALNGTALFISHTNLR